MAITRILKLESDDPEREREFDLEWLLSLTSAERYSLMLRRSTDALERMIRNGHLRPAEIIKRAARPVRRGRRKRLSRPRLRADDRGH